MSQILPKSSLDIRLTESVIFLNAGDMFHAARRAGTDTRPSLLRGLLTLNLAKPTKISSIEIELQAKTSSSTRPEGIGPMTIDISEDQKLFSAATIFFKADSSRERRSVSACPSSHSRENWHGWADGTSATDQHGPPSRDSTGSSPKARRMSVDGTTFQSDVFSHREESIVPQHPRSPRLSTASSSSISSVSSTLSLQNRDYNRPRSPDRTGRASLRNASRPQDSQATHSSTSLMPALSQEGGITENSTQNIPAPAYTPKPRPPSSPPVYRRPTSSLGIPSALAALERQPSTAPSLSFGPSIDERSHVRMSLQSSVASIWCALKDGGLKPPEEGLRAVQDGVARGALAHDKGKERMGEENLSCTEPSRMSRFGRLSHLPWLESQDYKELGNGWKEFKKGVYTYPISFSIPGNAPPTLVCDFGQVTWRLKAQVHRPGVFASKLCASHEVIVIATPGEEDTEETDNTLVERVWDSQLHYLISISGKSFPIGGNIPVHLTMVSLDKVHVHGIFAWLEERVLHYNCTRSIARAEPVNTMALLSLKHFQNGDALLPMDTSLENSPLRSLLTNGDDVSELAASFMGPGPWSLHWDLKLPESCSELHFSNSNLASSINVSHTLKISMRVEKGSGGSEEGETEGVEGANKKKRLFDIIVKMPVHILSCRCNRDWTTLPRYSETFTNNVSTAQSCPCVLKSRARKHANSEHQRHGKGDIAASTGYLSDDVDRSVEGGARSTRSMLFEQNSRFERLMSGQESELGECPPSYCSVTPSIEQRRSRSALGYPSSRQEI